jgi:hypothetical protein
MSNAPNDNLSKEAPQWMRDMFEELKDMFEGLFPDADKLNLEEMQRRLDERYRNRAAGAFRATDRAFMLSDVKV